MESGRRPEFEEVPHEGRANKAEMEKAPHSVMADVDDLQMARRLIEDLEEHDIPANAIELIGAETKDAPDPDSDEAVAESGAVRALFRSIVAGGLVGLAVGGLLGLAMAWLIPGLSWSWGLAVGALFGLAVGATAGGMSVAKYSSPAWNETHEVEETKNVQVAVHHADVDVINTAETVLERHATGEVKRLGTREG